MKTYTFKTLAPGERERFLAYMIPRQAPKDPHTTAPAAARQYHWLREYNYSVANKDQQGTRERSNLLFFRRPGAPNVTFLEMETTLYMKKRRRPREMTDEQDNARHKRIVVEFRDRTETEWQDFRKRVEELTGGMEDGQEEEYAMRDREYGEGFIADDVAEPDDLIEENQDAFNDSLDDVEERNIGGDDEVNGGM